MSQLLINKFECFKNTQKEIESHLTGNWTLDEWSINKLNPKIKLNGRKRICFTVDNVFLKNELKLAVKVAIEDGWKVSANLSYFISFFTCVINKNNVTAYSLIEKPLAYWESIFHTEMSDRGFVVFKHNTKYFSKSKGKYKDRKKSTHQHISRLRKLYKVIEDFYSKDLDPWDLDKVCPISAGLKIPPGTSPTPLNFTQIHQTWLRKAVKNVWKDLSHTRKYLSLKSKLTAINNFSDFLLKKHPEISSPYVINRKLIESFIDFIKDSKINSFKNNGKKKQSSTIQRQLIDLRVFLESEKAIEHKFPDERLIWDDDLPNISKFSNADKYIIPETVRSQILKHIDKLTPPWNLALAILNETGARSGEIFSLERNCIQQDADGDYHFRRYLSKQEKWHVVPISKSLADAILIQASQVIEKHGLSCPWLFPNDSGKPYHKTSFDRHYHEWAVENNICDENGKIWVPNPHLYRHSVATRMINNDIAQHIVRRYLGHSSDEMTQVYATLLDETAKDEFIEFNKNKQNKIVEKVSLEAAKAHLESSWIKETLMTQILPNGVCLLPIRLRDCPHSNACLFCETYFKTTDEFLPVHEAQYKETLELEITCKNNGWHRHAKKLEDTRVRLEGIISDLKSNDNEKNCKNPILEK